MRRIFAVFAVSLVALAAATHDARALELPAGFSTVELATGLDGPTALAYAPDGRLFIAEKAGRVRVVDAAGRLQPDPVIDIRDHVNSYWEHGLLGLAVDADFATNGFLYLLYVYEDNALDQTGPKTSRLTRIKVTSDNRADPAAPERVLVGSVSQAPCPEAADTVDCIPANGSSHAIGTVRADRDGTLWFGSGDAANWDAVDPTALRTYDEHTFAGKLMHVSRGGRGLPGHPFCPGESDLTKVCTKLYAKGFRNPYRFQLRPSAGPLVGDVGWGGFEEIDLAKPGRNYGWPCYEGAGRTPDYEELAGCTAEYAAGASAHEPPAHAYPHTGSAAIVAGPRYEAAQYPPAYRGAWFFGDYAMGVLWRMTLDQQGQVSDVEQFATGLEGGVDLELAPNGDLVYVSIGADATSGSVQRIVYPPDPAPAQPLPVPPVLPAAPLTRSSPAPPAAAPRLVLDAIAPGPSARRLGGRVLGGVEPLRVDVALRLRRGHKGCRWWRRPLRRLSAAPSRCARPLWMKAHVDRSGRWRLDLRGRPRAGSYAVLARARTLEARPRVMAHAIWGVRIR